MHVFSQDENESKHRHDSRIHSEMESGCLGRVTLLGLLGVWGHLVTVMHLRQIPLGAAVVQGVRIVVGDSGGLREGGLPHPVGGGD